MTDPKPLDDKWLNTLCGKERSNMLVSRKKIIITGYHLIKRPKAEAVTKSLQDKGVSSY